MPRTERRTHRAEVLSDALDLLLESCRKEGNLDLMVVADDLGLVVASSKTERIEAEELAAKLPQSDRSEDVAAFSFHSSGQKLYVGALGNREQATPQMTNVMRGTQRILASADAAH